MGDQSSDETRRGGKLIASAGGQLVLDVLQDLAQALGHVLPQSGRHYVGEGAQVRGGLAVGKEMVAIGRHVLAELLGITAVRRDSLAARAENDGCGILVRHSRAGAFDGCLVRLRERLEHREVKVQRPREEDSVPFKHLDPRSERGQVGVPGVHLLQGVVAQ